MTPGETAAEAARLLKVHGDARAVLRALRAQAARLVAEMPAVMATNDPAAIADLSRRMQSVRLVTALVDARLDVAHAEADHVLEHHVGRMHP